eukprot:scaffold247351_cov21-Tisochrysis_lutea.AAC.1
MPPDANATSFSSTSAPRALVPQKLATWSALLGVRSKVRLACVLDTCCAFMMMRLQRPRPEAY